MPHAQRASVSGRRLAARTADCRGRTTPPPPIGLVGVPRSCREPSWSPLADYRLGGVATTGPQEILPAVFGFSARRRLIGEVPRGSRPPAAHFPGSRVPAAVGGGLPCGGRSRAV